MSVKEKVNKIKIARLFRIGDLILYLTILMVVLSLFLGFVIFPSRELSNGFQALVGNESILTFKYDNDYDINQNFADNVSVKIESNTYKFTISTENNGYNVISVDTVNKLVSVTESNCSISKDCVHTPALTVKGGAIICVPHNLKIVPLGDGYRPPITG